MTKFGNYWYNATPCTDKGINLKRLDSKADHLPKQTTSSPTNISLFILKWENKIRWQSMIKGRLGTDWFVLYFPWSPTYIPDQIIVL